jgi:hypothetical protein
MVDASMSTKYWLTSLPQVNHSSGNGQLPATKDNVYFALDQTLMDTPLCMKWGTKNSVRLIKVFVFRSQKLQLHDQNP